MLQSHLRQPLGRLSFSLNIARGVVGVARLPLYLTRTHGFLTSAAQLNDTNTTATETKNVAPKAGTTKTKTKAATGAAKPKAKRQAKEVVVKQPKLFKKDIVQPVKRPLYGYAQYVQEIRIASGSKDCLKPTLQEASPKWKALTDEEKKKYAINHEAMKEYSEKMREWRLGLSPEERKVLGLKALRAPRPLNAYHMVFKEVFAKNPELSFLEKSAIVTERYKNMSPEEKDEYKQKALDAFNAEHSA